MGGGNGHWRERSLGGRSGADDRVVGVEIAGAVLDLGAQAGVAAGGFLDLGGPDLSFKSFDGINFVPRAFIEPDSC